MGGSCVIVVTAHPEGRAFKSFELDLSEDDNVDTLCESLLSCLVLLPGDRPTMHKQQLGNNGTTTYPIISQKRLLGVVQRWVNDTTIDDLPKDQDGIPTVYVRLSELGHDPPQLVTPAAPPQVTPPSARSSHKSAGIQGTKGAGRGRSQPAQKRAVAVARSVLMRKTADGRFYTWTEVPEVEGAFPCRCHSSSTTLVGLLCSTV
jgi:hypothetical protein